MDLRFYLDFLALLDFENFETFYVCKIDFVKFDINGSLDVDFKCPECGKLLKEEKIVHDFDRIKKEIEILEQELIQKPKVIPIIKPPKKKQKQKPVSKFSKSKRAKKSR